MSSDIICPLPKEYDNPIENVRKTSGDLDDTKKALVFNTDRVVKGGNTDMVDKKIKQNLMWRGKPSLLLFQQKRRLTQSTKQSNCKHPMKQYKCSSPRRSIHSHFLIFSKNDLFIVGIGPIFNK